MLLDHDGNGSSYGGRLSSSENLVVTKLGSEGGRVIVKLVRNIVVRVRRWRFVREVFGRKVPRGFRVEVRLRMQRDGREHLLQEVIVDFVGVEV